MNKKTIAAGAAAAALAGTIALGGTAAASDCNIDQVKIMGECGTVTETLPDEVRSSGTGKISSVTPSVGVDLRDGNGNRTTSGLSSKDQFEWLGGTKPGKNGDGTLIEVKQITEGMGGWGPLYQGWIPVKYTQLPSMFS